MTIDHETSSAEHTDHAQPEDWDAIAADYAVYVAPGEQQLSAEALHLVGLRSDESFLDVAAGPGGLGLAAARLGATVLATDWAPLMVAEFETRIHAEGLTRASARVMDAHALEIDDGQFDVSGSQFGVMLVPDQPVALREMVRVTKPGGRVLVVAYGSPADYQALQLFITALQTVNPEFTGLPEPPPLEFQVADPRVLRERLTSAGLRDVHVDTDHRERLSFRSGEDCWNWIRSGNPIVDMILEEVAAGDQARVRTALDELIRVRTDDRGIAVLTASLNIGWGRKHEAT